MNGHCAIEKRAASLYINQYINCAVKILNV